MISAQLQESFVILNDYFFSAPSVDHSFITNFDESSLGLLDKS
jgi:serine/threonine protein kinase